MPRLAKQSEAAKPPEPVLATCAKCGKELRKGDLVFFGDSGEHQGKCYCYDDAAFPFGYFDLLEAHDPNELMLVP